MITEPLSATVPTATGQNIAATTPPAEAGGSDPTAFLNALMQRLQSSGPQAGLDPSVSQPLSESELAGAQAPLAMDQLAILAGHIAVCGMAPGGNSAVEDGKSLPLPDDMASDTESLTSAQLEQLAANFTPLQVPSTLDVGPSGEPSTPGAAVDMPWAQGVQNLGEAGKPQSQGPSTPTPPESFPLPQELLDLVASKAGQSGDGVPSATSPIPGGEGVSPPDSAATTGGEITAVPPFSRPFLDGITDVPQSELTDVKHPVGHPGWAEDVGQRVVWMTGKGLQSAELKLNPQHLGPLEVRIDLSQDQASVQFIAHSTSVREAIEAAIPKLRDMLGEQQLTLADVSVNQHAFEGQREQRGAPSAYDQQTKSGGQGRKNAVEVPDEAGMTQCEGQAVSSHRTVRGLLNLYA